MAEPNQTPVGTLVPGKMPKEELRLALAMRGGVSLAVWIGGACAEIDALRRASKEDETLSNSEKGLYATLLDLAGFSSVVIDVISGASAGGLNGVILSAAIAYRADFTTMRDIWIELADIEKMIRPASEKDPPSLLMGDKYFLDRLERRLREMIAPTDSPVTVREDHFDLFLSATLLEPKQVRLPADPEGIITERSHAATFHFRHRGPDKYLSDFVGSDKVVARRLAIAGRATSSFPIAFEPAEIISSLPDAVRRRAPSQERDDLRGIFSECGTGPIQVIDGGVLDNIPVEGAIAAIQAAPAGGPTQRRLLFLHPSPEAIPDKEPQEEAPSAIKTGMRALFVKSDTESLHSDIGALKGHNQSADDARRLREKLFPVSGQPTIRKVFNRAHLEYEGYRVLRGQYAADEILSLLRDPVGWLKGNPFPNKISAPMEGFRNESTLRMLIVNSRKTLLGDWPVWSQAEAQSPEKLDIGALVRSVKLILEWLRDLEARLPEEASRRRAGALKRVLYDIGFLADLLIDYDDLWWVANAANRIPASEGLNEWVGNAFAGATAAVALHAHECSAQELIANLTATISATREGPQPGLTGNDLSRLEDCLSQRVTGVLNKDVSTPVPPSLDLRQSLWNLLSTIVSEAPAPPPNSLEGDLDPTFAALSAAAGKPVTRVRWHLAALEVLTFPLLEILPPARRIELERVSAMNESPIEDYFAGAGDHEPADRPKWKLTGNELMNFAAFLKPHWRANDWMWGRLDAVGSLVEMVMQPDRVLNRFLSERGPANRVQDGPPWLVRRVKEYVTRPVDLSSTSGENQATRWEKLFAGIWDKSREAVTQEANNLFSFEEDNAPTTLAATQRVLIERRQWDLVISELPVVVGEAGTDERGDLNAAVNAVEQMGLDPLSSPDGMKKLLLRYRVGEETVSGEIGTRHMNRVAANLAGVTWKAAAHDVPGYLRPIGWLINLVRILVLTVATAPRWALATMPVAALIAGSLAVTGPHFGVGRPIFAVIGLALVSVLYYGARFDRALLFIAATGLALALIVRIDATLDVTTRVGQSERVTEIDVGWIPVLVIVLATVWIVRHVAYPLREPVVVVAGFMGVLTLPFLLVPTLWQSVEEWLAGWIPQGWVGVVGRPILLLVAVGFLPTIEAAFDWGWPRLRDGFPSYLAPFVAGLGIVGLGVGVGFLRFGWTGPIFTVAIALLVGFIYRRRGAESLGISARSLATSRGPIFAALAAGALVLAIWDGLGYPGVENVTPGAQPESVGELALILLRIVLVTALFEEFLFRGGLWAAFTSRSRNDAGVALLFTSLLFALWHVGPSIHASRVMGQDPSISVVLRDIAVTFLLGLVLGRLRQRTAGIWASVVAHSVVNGLGAIGYYLNA